MLLRAGQLPPVMSADETFDLRALQYDIPLGKEPTD
jgi:hypothetical protein